MTIISNRDSSHLSFFPPSLDLCRPRAHIFILLSLLLIRLPGGDSIAMHLLSVLALILLTACSALAQYVDLESFSDGTYGFTKYWAMDSEPHASTQAAYSRAAYDDMMRQSDQMGLRAPSTMSAAWWPNRNGRGGTMILHSSIKVRLT